MKRWVVISGVLLLSSMISANTAKAQDTPKVEVFGGYSYLHVSDGGSTANANGGSASVSYNPVSALGIVADFGGYHGNSSLGDSNVYTYLFGPKLALRGHRLIPFVQALFGGAHVTAGGFSTASANAFAMALGGGVDWNATAHIGIRLVQGEYLMTKFNDGGNNVQNNARISAGVVFRW